MYMQSLCKQDWLSMPVYCVAMHATDLALTVTYVRGLAQGTSRDFYCDFYPIVISPVTPPATSSAARARAPASLVNWISLDFLPNSSCRVASDFARSSWFLQSGWVPPRFLALGSGIPGFTWVHRPFDLLVPVLVLVLVQGPLCSASDPPRAIHKTKTVLLFKQLC